MIGNSRKEDCDAMHLTTHILALCRYVGSENRKKYIEALIDGVCNNCPTHVEGKKCDLRNELDQVVGSWADEMGSDNS